MFKKRNILLFLTIVTFGCSTESGPATVYDIAIVFSVINENGEDLLAPTHPSAITEQNTDLYYSIDDSLVKQFHENLDSPKMFFVSEEKSPFNEYYYMSIFSNIIDGEDMALTYLEFEDNSMDTILTQYKQGQNNTHLTKVWYNGDLKCDLYDKENPNLASTKYGACYFVVTR